MSPAPYEERAGSPRGAPMGRHSDPASGVPALPVNLDAVPLDGGYDAGGAYWGDHLSLFCAWVEPAATGWRLFVRAASRREAGQDIEATAGRPIRWSQPLQDPANPGSAFWISATYANQRGHVRHWAAEVEAPTMAEAMTKARAHLSTLYASKVDMVANPIRKDNHA